MRIVSLRIKTAEEWRELIGQPGQFFLPTTEALAPGEEFVIELSSSLLPNDILLQATANSWRPATPRARIRAGATVSIPASEAHKFEFISKAFASEIPTVKRKYPRLPVKLAATFRLTNATAATSTVLLELGMGGALLATAEPVPIGTTLTIDILPPKSVMPLQISARVSYHGRDGATGIAFSQKDRAGAQRLAELVRRVRQS